MSRIRLIFVCLLAVAAAGCKAQTNPVAAGSPVDRETARKIEVLAREKLKVPTEYVVTVGQRSPGEIPGFDKVNVTFSLPGHADHTQTLSFLISKDGQTLARLSEWNIAKNPADLVPYANRPVRGNPDAKVVIVNFDDLECPYCAKMHAELFPDTLDHYKGLIKVVYRDLPLEELHPWAMHAAVDANCLASQNASAYWSYVDYLHVHGEDVTGPDRNLVKANATLDKLATQQGVKSALDAATLSACVAKQDETAVRSEVKQAEDLGIEQTPTLYVNGEQMQGALDVSTLWTIIDRALVSEGVTPPAAPKPPEPAKQGN
ncbi:protein-disulfide isomerase [Silvibacterium bohemicum]|uniref:Protein-disulfide isomerase n=1 Tax=Silvibacterium bohemicum TaxID=1577686 RepID=A0A841K598_9BACT|nr:thioredoxin domain-containing protein [Silvibacterium bohemicum]MBB6145454.1 protein-disulfide isomerase [Silvibacterium bohemicum]